MMGLIYDADLKLIAGIMAAEDALAAQAYRPAVSARECELMATLGRVRAQHDALDSLAAEQRLSLHRAATAQGIHDAIGRLVPAKTTVEDLQAILGALGSLADAMVMHSDTSLIADLIDQAGDACEAETKRTELAAADAEWEGA